MGHTKVPFCLQSCVKPLTYAISISTLGTDYVHRFVGKEPSGLRYNTLSLNEEGECPRAQTRLPAAPPTPALSTQPPLLPQPSPRGLCCFFLLPFLSLAAVGPPCCADCP